MEISNQLQSAPRRLQVKDCRPISTLILEALLIYDPIIHLNDRTLPETSSLEHSNPSGIIKCECATFAVSSSSLYAC